jgi:hypothetical protein
MSEFTLPSGRVLTLKDRANWGDISDAQDEAVVLGGKLNHYYRALDSIMTGLTLDEVRALDPDDGRALEKEVMRRSGARSVEDETPFGNQSSTDSTAKTSETPSPDDA